MKLKAFALAAACAMSCATFAAAPAPAAKESPDDIICTTDTTTGSHLPRRTCATRAQREQRAKEDQQAMKDFQRGRGGAPSASSPLGH